MNNELKTELLEALRIGVDKYFIEGSDQPRTFSCHHAAETCFACAGMVRRWKEQNKIRAAIAKLENEPADEIKLEEQGK